jgi:hypothetical protein
MVGQFLDFCARQRFQDIYIFSIAFPNLADMRPDPQIYQQGEVLFRFVSVGHKLNNQDLYNLSL